MEGVLERETDSEMVQSPRRMTSFELENEFRPQSPQPNDLTHDQNQESHPLSPKIVWPDEEERADSARDLGMDDLGDEDHQDEDRSDEDEEDHQHSDEEDRHYSDEEDPAPITSEESESESDESDDEPHITLANMKSNLEFVGMVENATLESQFSPAVLRDFRNPQGLQFSPSDDEDLRLSIKLFISSLDHNQSQIGYAKNREAILDRYPDSEVLSYDRVKQRVSNLSGVITLKNDMCVDSHVAFTGPFAHLERCPRCGQSRYDEAKLAKSGGKKKVPRKVFTTFPVGPQLQACWKSPETAQKMLYRRHKTEEILRAQGQGEDYAFDDVFCGTDYLDAVENGKIKEYDTVVMLSIDGAQLHRNKKSDCWIYIWIILDLAPDQRYKIRNILPGGIIPGPNNPKHLDSFLFPGLAHLSALQKEGLHIWDGYNSVAAISFIFLLLVLADAIASAQLTGSVGHHGRKGCRILCELPGRNKPCGSHYYPVLLRPLDSNDDGSNHPSFDINNLPPVDPLAYRRNLNHVLSSPNEAEYRRRRLDTGIRKATIFDGLKDILEPPTCFPGDIMHQPVINLTSLMLELWRAQGNTRSGDDSDDEWPWAVLKGDVWKAHGKAVAEAASHFPQSFDRTPRNPAEKISSGYKAWESLLYFYGLGPGLFYGLLPEVYYRHYCKLVVGIRIMYQNTITPPQLRLAHQHLIEWVMEFEVLYYQQKTARIHFVHQCIHSLVHLVPETIRIGPPSLSAQWTMERVIGHFGLLLKQPSNLFANLTEQAKKIAEINAIVAMWPSLEPVQKDPRGSIDLGDGYLLLWPKDHKPYRLSPAEWDALTTFYSGLPNGSIAKRSVCRWGRLRIPNGQTARSYWKEVIRVPRSARTDRMLKVHDPISIVTSV